ncbi:hypothetical protein EDB84DRAFT_1572414 [Lactarius hengduanensis]|nr:hypothetical protein EDB84DRAFT_1572414 [Lactarius hengduanensis]
MVEETLDVEQEGSALTFGAESGLKNYNCDIDARNLPAQDNWGPIDGAPINDEPSTSEPRTPAPSESGESDHTEEEEEERDDSQAEVTNPLVIRAESLHIKQPEIIHVRSPADMATVTITHDELANEEARRVREEAEDHTPAHTPLNRSSYDRRRRRYIQSGRPRSPRPTGRRRPPPRNPRDSQEEEDFQVEASQAEEEDSQAEEEDPPSDPQ